VLQAKFDEVMHEAGELPENSLQRALTTLQRFRQRAVEHAGKRFRN